MVPGDEGIVASLTLKRPSSHFVRLRALGGKTSS